MFVSVEPQPLTPTSRSTQLRPKGITFAFVASCSVVKEPASPKGRQDCQTPSSVSSGMFPFPKPSRLTRTRVPLGDETLERSGLPEELQGPRSVGCLRVVVNLVAQGTLITTQGGLLFPSARSFVRASLTPKLLLACELSSVLKERVSASGPAITAEGRGLFHELWKLREKLFPKQFS